MQKDGIVHFYRADKGQLIPLTDRKRQAVQRPYHIRKGGILCILPFLFPQILYGRTNVPAFVEDISDLLHRRHVFQMERADVNFFNHA